MMMMIIIYLDFCKKICEDLETLISEKPAHNSNINLQVECAPLCSPDWPCLVGLCLGIAKEKEKK